MARAAPAKFWLFTVQIEQQALAFQCLEFNMHVQETFDQWCDYLVYQKERVTHDHLQLFLKTKKKIRLSSVTSLPWFTDCPGITGVHAEKVVHVEQARAYCMKEDSRVEGPFEFGNWEEIPTQGTRSDLNDIYTALRAGATDAEIAERWSSQYIRYNRGINAVRLTLPHEMAVAGRRVYLCYGPSGCGKSHLVRLDHPHGGRGDPGRLWIAPAGALGWFDGFIGQRAALFDEFMGARSKVTCDAFLQWIDCWGCRVPVKGGFVWWNPRYIFICTNYHPSTWWDFSGRLDESWRPLCRRITGAYVWQSTDHGNYHYLTGDDLQLWLGPGYATGHVESPNMVIDLT